MPKVRSKKLIRAIALIVITSLTASFALLFSACGEKRFFVTLMDDDEVLTTILTDDGGYADVPDWKKEGYAFDGWYYDANRKFSPQDALRANTTLYCGWKSNSYVVTFDVNGGEALAKTEYTVLSGEKIAEAPVPVREHYSFIGWIYNGQPVDLGKGFDLARDATFTARWKANAYTINYNAGGGIITDNNGNEFVGSSVRQSVSYGAEYEAYSARLAGYTFTGWRDSDGQTFTSGIWLGEADLTVTARYTANRYAVTFDYGDGTSAVTDVTFGSAYDFGTYESSIEGYVFKRWYYIADGERITVASAGDAWNFAGNATLFAEYKANEYSLSLYMNASDDAPFDSFTVPFYSLLKFGSEPEAPSGKVFAGWYTQDGTRLMPDSVWSYNDDVSAVASFIDAGGAVTLETEYYLENADGTFARQTDGYRIYCYPGERVTVDTSGFGNKYDGYYFDGSYGTNVNTTVTLADENVILKYYFLRDRYTCTFESDGVTIGSYEVRWGEEFTLPADTLKKGYELVGWRIGGATFTGTYIAGRDNLRFVAVWKTKTFTVCLDGLTAFTVDYNGRVDQQTSSLVLPDTDERSFAGWSIDGTLIMTREQAASLTVWDFDSTTKLADGTYEMRLVSEWSPKIAEYDIEIYLENDDGGFTLSVEHSLTEKGAIGRKVFFDAYTYDIDGYVFDRANENNLLIDEVAFSENAEGRTTLKAYFRKSEAVDTPKNYN